MKVHVEWVVVVGVGASVGVWVLVWGRRAATTASALEVAPDAVQLGPRAPYGWVGVQKGGAWWRGGWVFNMQPHEGVGRRRGLGLMAAEPDAAGRNAAGTWAHACRNCKTIIPSQARESTCRGNPGHGFSVPRQQRGRT